MHKLKPYGFLIFFTLAVLVITGSYLFGSNLLDSESNKTLTCSIPGRHYNSTINSGKVTPRVTYANLCDTLTITNNDSVDRLIAFGPHESHITYDGVSERLLAPGDDLTIILNKTGNYTFHDHTDPTVEGTFIVYTPLSEQFDK